MALAAPCPDGAPATVDGFRTELDALWRQGLAGDDVVFRTGVAQQEASLSCVAEPLPPLDAARLHRNRALLAARSGDPLGAARAVASMRRVADGSEDPGADDRWLVESDTLAGFAKTDAAAPPTAEFGTSLAASVFIDGRETQERPLDQPVVVQVVGPDGSMVDATWLPARQPLPTWVQYPPSACDERQGSAGLVQASRQAETAFANLDVDGFREALRTAATGLPCADGVLSPSEAAAIHRLEGVRLYTLGARDSALRSLQQARILDPLGTIEGDALAPGSPLARLWDQAATASPPPWVPVDAPDGLDVRVDGIPSRQRPATVPSVVQLATPTGRVIWTSYVPAMASLPSLAAFAGPTPEQLDLAPARRVYLEDELRRKRSTRRQALLLTGSALLVTSGMAWQANRNAVSDYNGIETAPEHLEGHRRRANAMATAASASGALGAGLFGVVLLFEL